MIKTYEKQLNWKVDHRRILGYDDNGIVIVELLKLYGSDIWLNPRTKTEYVNVDYAVKHSNELYSEGKLSKYNT